MTTTPPTPRPFAPLLLVALLAAACGDGEPAPVPTTERSTAPAEPATEPAVDEVAPVAIAEPEPDPVAPEPEPDPRRAWVRHVTAEGASFEHPPDWTVQRAPGGLTITPAGADPRAELILAAAAPARGLDDPLSPRAARELDRLVRGAMPGLRRRGQGRPVRIDVGPAAAYDYTGRGPDGRTVEARVFVAIASGHAASFAVVSADAEGFEDRSATLETIFRSLRKEASAADAGDVDPRLAGRRFRGEAIASGNGVYVNTQLVWAFNPDGSVLHGASSAMSASERDHTGALEWTASGTTAGSVQRGRYGTRGGILELRWGDGQTARAAYGFEPDGSLVLRDPVTGKLRNVYAPMR